jgi:predicted transposase/invertase (TIGR01784 family)
MEDLMNKDQFSPLYDDAVKVIFGDQKNIENLAGLLKPILDLPPEDYDTLTIVDPFLKRLFRRDKLGILDVKVTTKTGRIVNVEIQVKPFSTMRKRIIYYLAKLLVEQLKSGFNYGKLVETVCVVICDHELVPEEKNFLNIYGLRNIKSGNLFTDLLKLYIIELPKLPRDDDGSPSWPWLQFFKCRKEEEFNMLAEKHPEVRPIIAEYKKLTWSERRRMIADLKEKYRRDHQAILDDALMDSKREIARALKAQGYSIEKIAAATQLSLEEIETL